jgi:hypothetical protein
MSLRMKFTSSPPLPSLSPSPLPAVTPFRSTQRPQQELKSLSPTEPSHSPGTALALGTEQELHYASLSSHGKNPHEDACTQYSELWIQ